MCTPTNRMPRRAAPLAIHLPRVLERHAELVALQPGGDVRMAPARRCPDSRAARRALRGRSARAIAAMRSSSPADSALIVPTPSAIANSSSSRVLPTPVKTMSVGAKPARSATSHLAAGVGVGAAAERSQQSHDGQRRVGLQRVVNRVRVRGERIVDGPDRRRGSLARCRCRPACRPARRSRAR